MDYLEFKFVEARFTAIEAALKKILVAITDIQKQEITIMASAQQIVDKVAEVQGAEDSTIELLDAVHAMLVDVKAQLTQQQVDTTALDNVITTLDANKQRLGDAVARNPLP